MASAGQQLIAAAAAGRVDETQTLITAGANVEETDTVSLEIAQGGQVGNAKWMRACKWRVDLSESASGFRAR